ncbi:MAG TPA: tetratricopeptide repeat protein, partial [Thermodesulfobacteriota bacterium]|nr:tetratricopeptide repeat protein [Thermodesulfobacteriota bacterium]
LGAAYFLKGNVPEARKYLEAARSQYPPDPKIYFYLGRVYQEEKLNDEALQAFLMSNKLDPNFAENYYHMAMAYSTAGNNGEAYRCLGYYYKLSGSPIQAIAQFQKAMPFFPDSSPEKAQMRKDIEELTPQKKDPPPNARPPAPSRRR